MNLIQYFIPKFHIIATVIKSSIKTGNIKSGNWFQSILIKHNSERKFSFVPSVTHLTSNHQYLRAVPLSWLPSHSSPRLFAFKTPNLNFETGSGHISMVILAYRSLLWRRYNIEF